ncbi:MAG TPA: hypothetical protein VIG28_00685 [Leifsonia sp.]|jgi:hypothetical protein
MAQRLLTQLGHDARDLDDGHLTWRAGTRAIGERTDEDGVLR